MTDNRRKQLFNKYWALRKAYEIHPGTIFMGNLNSLGGSYYIVEKNYRDLISNLIQYQSDITLIAYDNKDNFRLAMRETKRMLHNYLASVQSLIDHLRNFVNNENTQCYTEFSKLTEALRKNGCVTFTKDFRNYIQHNNLPIISMKMEFMRIPNSLKQRIFLNKSDLLKWDRWSSNSKTYLQGLGEDLDLISLFEVYQKLNREHHRIIITKLVEFHLQEISDMKKLGTEIIEMETQLGHGPH
jgi:hypothetical protein